ncbi:metalloendopeptidase [Nostoc sp. T09]|uniref:DUF3352 domain-containing protein n=1 Tax=Nostoc sp. T09 TaxID=1932621 RepID=UPI000A371F6A|nr:DUF3352 domain-containing protein [Nostoc sp. T09]OUL36441.1 metalloendopeptidase [Nostoc sp. T09]
MPESKSKFLIPTIGAAVVLTGGIAAYMYFKGGPAGDGAGALGSAKVVPSSALMATYITTDPQAWAKLQQFGTPEAQQLVAKGLESFNKDMLKDSNISYEKDIKPWAGDVMVAVLPPTAVKPAQFNTPATPNKPLKLQSEPNILLVIGIKDKIAALNFGNKLKAQKGVKFQESDYKGEKITETTDKGKPTYSVVLNNSQLILAPEKQAVEQAIDTFKGQPSFASKEGASNILSRGVDVKNTLAQIYIPDYAGMVKQLAAANPQGTQLPPQTLKQLQQVKSMVAGVSVDDAGLRVKAIANLDPQLNKFQYQNTPAKIVGQFPTDTFALVSGQGISRAWSSVLEQSKDYPEFNQAVAQVRQQLKSVVNLDLDKDIIGWMDGEFALGMIPSNQGILASVGFGGALLFDTNDRKTAESTLSKLDDLIKKQSVKVAQRNVGGKDITEWQVPQQGALLSHGWLDRDTLFVAIGEPVAQAIASNKSQSLDNSDTFKAVTGSLQKPNGGYFYVDMDKTMTLVNRFAVAQPVPPEASAILSSIRGLGVTATSPDKSTSQVEMLLALKPKTAK